MPIQNRDDVVEVQGQISAVFGSSSEGRANVVRRLFVETLDFGSDSGQVSLAGAPSNAMLPDAAERVAILDGVHVLYVGLDIDATDRVRKAEVDAAARLVASQLGDDLLLVFTNTSASQLHFILPKFEGARPILRRMVVERDLPHRTAVQQVARIFWNHRDMGFIRAALEDAFDVEPVTKEFFGEYKRIFEETMGAVAGFGEGENEDKRVFVQTLFNRLMFVYFLSRKGWLRFDGDADYLNRLWQDYRSQERETNFHVARLKCLFFEGLNNPQSHNLERDNPELYSAIKDVKFLNGGLFEETELDRRDGITVPDSAITQVLEELFNKFNFTVMESTPFDIEVAVDPEMLGKVFEELVTGRHDSGAYYTPRRVVSYMCREALKGYLEGQDTGLASEAIALFVDLQDTEGIGVPQARDLARALAEVNVVDPACGSGAYLLGMMQELIELQTALYNAGADAKALYDLKLEIIQRNLYGVDIDSFAVNIAMLRMWLSLAIDYEGATPEPLPNLDFKVVCGDSLLGPDPSSGAEVQGTLGQDVAQMRRLGELKGEFMRAKPGPGKDCLRADIEFTKAEIRESLGIVANEESLNWRVEFAEVFGDGHGFDIAIANPPYVQLEKDNGRLRSLYKDCGFATLTPRGDIYQLFYERGCQLLQPGSGILAYITSNSWLRAEYGKPLRRYFVERHRPMLLLELGKDVFESAIVDSGVLMIRTGGGAQPFPAVDMDRVKSTEVPPPAELWGQARPEGDDPWGVMSPRQHDILAKMRGKGKTLKNWDVNISYGIKTGYNKAFILDDTTRTTLIVSDPNSAEIIKPVLRGKDIRRFRSEWTGQWLIVAKFGSHSTLPDEFPAVYQHLLQHEQKLRARGQCRYSRSSRKNADYPGQHHWLELDNNPRDSYLDTFAKEKLLWIELVDEGRFSYDNSGILGEATTFMMTGGRSLKYLCAVLNSVLARWFLSQVAPTSGMGTLRWKKVYVENIPVPEISAAKQRPFVRLVDRILEAKAADSNVDTSDLEEQIDWLVYDLYGLTDEETAAVADYFWDGSMSEDEEDLALARAMDEGDVNDRVSLAEVREILRAPDEC